MGKFYFGFPYSRGKIMDGFTQEIFKQRYPREKILENISKSDSIENYIYKEDIRNPTILFPLTSLNDLDIIQSIPQDIIKPLINYKSSTSSVIEISIQIAFKNKNYFDLLDYYVKNEGDFNYIPKSSQREEYLWEYVEYLARPENIEFNKIKNKKYVKEVWNIIKNSPHLEKYVIKTN